MKLGEKSNEVGALMVKRISQWAVMLEESEVEERRFPCRATV